MEYVIIILVIIIVIFFGAMALKLSQLKRQVGTLTRINEMFNEEILDNHTEKQELQHKVKS